MADPNLPTVRDDGTVDTGDRPGWVWVSDTQTGHRFDVRSNRLPRYGVEVVPGVPVNYGKAARSAKAFVGKGGEPATPRPAEVASGDVARAERIADQQAADQAVPVELAMDPNEVGRPDTAFTVATADTKPHASRNSTTPDVASDGKAKRAKP